MVWYLICYILLQPPNLILGINENILIIIGLTQKHKILKADKNIVA